MFEIKQIYNIEHIYDLVNFEYNTHYTYIQDQKDSKRFQGMGLVKSTSLHSPKFKAIKSRLLNVWSGVNVI